MDSRKNHQRIDTCDGVFGWIEFGRELAFKLQKADSKFNLCRCAFRYNANNVLFVFPLLLFLSQLRLYKIAKGQFQV